MGRRHEGNIEWKETLELSPLEAGSYRQMPSLISIPRKILRVKQKPVVPSESYTF